MFTRLPNSPDLNGDFFDRELQDFEDAINERLVPCPQDPDGRILTNPGNVCGDCCIRFYYYHHGNLDRQNGYKDSIWIKVLNDNPEIEIWIRINITHTGRRSIQVYSSCKLNCNILYQIRDDHRGLPLYFHPQGIWREANRAIMQSNSDIIDRMCELLPYLCNARCVQ